jgi:hypothetical protein
MDVYPTKTLSIYLDYNIDTDSSAGNCVYLGLEFAL